MSSSQIDRRMANNQRSSLVPGTNWFARSIARRQVAWTRSSAASLARESTRAYRQRRARQGCRPARTSRRLASLMRASNPVPIISGFARSRKAAQGTEKRWQLNGTDLMSKRNSTSSEPYARTALAARWRAMGRLFASICGANLTSRAPRINKAREPELECGGARLRPRRCAHVGEGDGPSPSPRPEIWSAFGASAEPTKRAGSVVAQIWVH